MSTSGGLFQRSLLRSAEEEQADIPNDSRTGDWTDPRVHLLDDTWLLTIFAILLAAAVPWLMSGLDVNFIGVCLGLLALAAIHIVLTTTGRPARTGERRAVLTMLHALGIVVVGFIWLQAGGLHNPTFLIAFVLPVVGAIFLSHWQPYVMALVAVLVVGAVALAQAPELRWYAPGLNAIGSWLAAVLGQQGASSVPFPGLAAPSGYFVVLLQVFAILVFACAIAAEYLGTIFERLQSHADVARAEAEHGQNFWKRLIQDLPLPALLVDTDTLNIVCTSGPASDFYAGKIANDAHLFETIHFSYPDVVQELLMESGGMAPLSMIKIGDRFRATEVHVRHVAAKSRHLALVVIHDKTEEFMARAALDVSEDAVLAIDARGRVVALNKPAQTLFGIDRLTEASRLLPIAGPQTPWWDPGLVGRRKLHIPIGAHIYQVTCAAAPLPGEDEQLYIAAFMRIARAAANDRTANTTSTHTGGAAHAAISGSKRASPS